MGIIKWKKLTNNDFKRYTSNQITKNQIKIWNLQVKFDWLHFIDKEPKLWGLIVSKVVLGYD